MEQFRIIYRILDALWQAMDIETPDYDMITAQSLGISEPMWTHIMRMLVLEGYIDGVTVIEYDDGRLEVRAVLPAITLKGLEYLEENVIMRKVANSAKRSVHVTL